jgi:pimeloyl-ACP methyl ester carboxylesterase
MSWQRFGLVSVTPPAPRTTPLATVNPAGKEVTYPLIPTAAVPMVPYAGPICTDLKCATIKVPLDWTKPSAGSITLSINYLASTGSADLGWILENPGGPGGSGLTFVAGGGEQVGSAALRKHYNVVGFDPRGVEKSSPIKCLNAKDTDEFLYGTTPGAPGSATEIAAQRKAMKKYIHYAEKYKIPITTKERGKKTIAELAKDINTYEHNPKNMKRILQQPIDAKYKERGLYLIDV